ncbi:hypothetical protein [Parasitella parasitica]|uniref:Uncharacterized protein n=1 Tax=Parasitella parasitica TaxID=35722 RepID=A0A0B7N4G3_9FUNG|nr:hypothetical protein [Parasitella parasitica]
MYGEAVTEHNGMSTESVIPSANRKIKTQIWCNAPIQGVQIPRDQVFGQDEVYPTKEIVDRFLAEGAMYEFENSKIQLHPCEDVDGEGAFGGILDLGLNYKRSMSWFMGAGYATSQCRLS